MSTIPPTRNSLLAQTLYDAGSSSSSLGRFASRIDAGVLGQIDNYFSALNPLLSPAPPPRESGLAALARALYPDPPPVPPQNAFLADALLRLPPQSRPSFVNALVPRPYLAPPPRPPARRHVFFSFHYDDVIRTVLVRNSWRIREEDGVPGFRDRSIWEKTKLTNPEGLKNLIRNGLKGTTVTCVLVGGETWERRWVRYEIAQSVINGNGLLAVHICDIGPQAHRTYGVRGSNPLHNMGLYYRDNGKAYLCEWTNGQWQQYADYQWPVEWPPYLPQPAFQMTPVSLSAGAAEYDYKADGGAKNLPEWARAAAHAAGR